MKVLAISNSFGNDGLRYVFGISRTEGHEIRTYNLDIGGCTLEKHYRNLLSDDKSYTVEVNGLDTPMHLSIKEALLMDKWDVISLQQNSPDAGIYETYHPYIDELVAMIRKTNPSAKLALQMTWTYDRSNHMFNNMPYHTPEEMLPKVIETYKKVGQEIGADLYIPSGEGMWELFNTIGGEKTYRDAHHASWGVGRYLLGMIWYMALMNKKVKKFAFTDFDGGEMSPEDKKAAEECALKVCKQYGFWR